MLRANERPGGEARGVVIGQFQQTDPITTARPSAISIEPLLTVDDLCLILKCSRRLIERMRSSGGIPAPDIMLGNVGKNGKGPRFPRWKRSTIERWMEGGTE